MMRSALLLLALGAAPAFAQSAGAITQVSDELMDAADLGTDLANPAEQLAATLPALAPGTNVVVVSQIGSDNQVTAEQIGLDNVAAITVIGSGNEHDLVQDGTGNLYLGAIFGDDNAVSVGQFGDGNEYQLLMLGTNPAHTVVQLGDGNRAQQYVAPGLRPAGIEQRGSGMEVIVERTGGL